MNTLLSQPFSRIFFPLILFSACSGAVSPEKPASDAAPVAVNSPAPAPTQATAPETLAQTPEKQQVVRQILKQPAQPTAVTGQVAVPVPQPATPPPALAVPIDTTPAIRETPAAPQVPDHEAWTKLLSRFVSAEGKVNYKEFKENKAELDAYCLDLAQHTPQNNWSRAEKTAYWINTYNAFTIRLIVEHYPVSSIMKLDGGKTWDVKRIRLGERQYSLNQIENDILRPEFKDARIHFAVNCAAKSCPPLLNRAYTAENLDQMLDERARKFINDGRYNNLAADKARLSRIFDWYAADFQDVRKFVNRYADTKLGAAAAIEFRDYDWDLNQ